MSDQPNLFKSAAYHDAVGEVLSVKSEIRTITDHYVIVGGVTFELGDLIDTLMEVTESSVQITNSDYEVLVTLGVLKSLGGRMGAAYEGENFADFYAKVEAAVRGIRDV